jgi:hypothetical protein
MRLSKNPQGAQLLGWLIVQDQQVLAGDAYVVALELSLPLLACPRLLAQGWLESRRTMLPTPSWARLLARNPARQAPAPVPGLARSHDLGPRRWGRAESQTMRRVGPPLPPRESCSAWGGRLRGDAGLRARTRAGRAPRPRGERRAKGGPRRTPRRTPRTSGVAPAHAPLAPPRSAQRAPPAARAL